MKTWIAMLKVAERALAAFSAWRRKKREEARQDEFDYIEDDSVGFFNERYGRLHDVERAEAKRTSSADYDHGESER